MRWPSDSFLIDSALILAVVLTGIVGYKLSPLAAPRADRFILADGRCDVHQGPCRTPLPEGGEVVFSLAPRPIEPMRPLTVDVEVKGRSAKRVQVDFAGVEMNMGFLRPTLTAVGEGRFTGETTLPVCVTGRMLWQATALIDDGRQRWAVAHRFEAGH